MQKLRSLRVGGQPHGIVVKFGILSFVGLDSRCGPVPLVSHTVAETHL